MYSIMSTLSKIRIHHVNTPFYEEISPGGLKNCISKSHSFLLQSRDV